MNIQTSFHTALENKIDVLLNVLNLSPHESRFLELVLGNTTVSLPLQL